MNDKENKTKYKVELTYDELIVLDGRVSDEAQGTINAAKFDNRLGFELPLINKLIRESVETGVFSFRTKQIRFCPICKRSGSYLKYKSGRNKGRSNFNKPTYLNGYKFNEGFITIQGDGDICRDCEQQYKVIETVKNYILEQNLPVELVGDKNSKFVKDLIQICFKCGKEIQTSKMGRLQVLMGNGTYPGQCPYCGAKATAFGSQHKSTGKFVMVEKQPHEGNLRG